eukprot:5565944-Prymnesium_polylepis.1
MWRVYVALCAHLVGQRPHRPAPCALRLTRNYSYLPYSRHSSHTWSTRWKISSVASRGRQCDAGAPDPPEE